MAGKRASGGKAVLQLALTPSHGLQSLGSSSHLARQPQPVRLLPRPSAPPLQVGVSPSPQLFRSWRFRRLLPAGGQGLTPGWGGWGWGTAGPHGLRARGYQSRGNTRVFQIFFHVFSGSACFHPSPSLRVLGYNQFGWGTADARGLGVGRSGGGTHSGVLLPPAACRPSKGQGHWDA